MDRWVQEAGDGRWAKWVNLFSFFNLNKLSKIIFNVKEMHSEYDDSASPLPPLTWFGLPSLCLGYHGLQNGLFSISPPSLPATAFLGEWALAAESSPFGVRHDFPTWGLLLGLALLLCPLLPPSPHPLQSPRSSPRASPAELLAGPQTHPGPVPIRVSALAPPGKGVPAPASALLCDQLVEITPQ